MVTSIAPAAAPKLTLDAVREKLAGQSGRRYWKNLDELAATPEFNDLMQEEFPRQAMQGEWVDAVSRRGFLKVMGASLALAGLAGCTKQPDEPIYPVHQAAGGSGSRPVDVLRDGISVSYGRDPGSRKVGRFPAYQD